MAEQRKYVSRRGYYPRKKGSNMRMINIWLPKGIIERLDFLVEQKLYSSRSDAIRTFVTDGIKEEVIETDLANR